MAFSRGGSSTALHVLQSALDIGGPSVIALKTDFKNAFNTRKRHDILSELFMVPALAPLFRLAHWAYRSPSLLLVSRGGVPFGGILSAEGVKQGDVLASLLFALSVHSYYSQCIDGLPNLRAVAVVDDFYLVGAPDTVFTVFDL